MIDSTRDDATGRNIARLIKEKRELEVAGPAFFARYLASQENAQEDDLSFDLHLEPGLAAWFSAWKQQNAVAAGRKLSRADWQEAVTRVS